MALRISNESKEWNSLEEGEKKIIESAQHSFPVKVGEIATNFGLRVKSSTLPAGISGSIKNEDGGYIIRVNRHDVKARQRFTVAHEIAHFLLHEEFIGDGITDDILYRSSLPSGKEAEANRLAADILMPWSLIKEQLSLSRTKPIEKRVLLLSDLAEVSTTAMNIRLGRA